MILPAAAIAVPLFVAFVLAALTYYKLDPARRVASRPFAMLVLPLALLVLYEVLQFVGFVVAAQGIVAFVIALATLAVSVQRARCLLPKPKGR